MTRQLIEASVHRVAWRKPTPSRSFHKVRRRAEAQGRLGQTHKNHRFLGHRFSNKYPSELGQVQNVFTYPFLIQFTGGLLSDQKI
jgi:hypothetical protein